MTISSFLLALVGCVLCVKYSATQNKTGADVFTLVTTTYGDLRGIEYSVNQVNLVKFLGIPYAQPPVGLRRFKPPEPLSKWSGVRDALNLGSECPQTFEVQWKLVQGPMSEDCLFLSVYAPTQNDTSGLLPVMVWIHGGAYILGGGSQYDGSDLAARGVVVVTFNYRLAALGFLSTETDEMPGNYGMLDQIQALHWVQENIAAFGGDPDQVTIFGESAGSTSVSLLTLSPLSKGLFKRAIMESGVCLSPWAINHPATHFSPRMLSRLVGDAVGCSNLDPAPLLTCLQTVDAFVLHNATDNILATLDTGLLLTPRVENVFGFLPDLPIRLLSNGEFHQVDSLRGFNSDEDGLMITDETNQGLTIESFKERVSNLFFRLYAFTDIDQLLQEIVEMYIGNATDPYFIRSQAIAVLSDLDFEGPTLTEINLVVKSAPNSKHYLYEFSYRPSYSWAEPWQGTVHADEIPYVFGVDNEVYQNFNVTPSAADRGVCEQIMTMWTNFAKTGDPTSSVPIGSETWKRYTSDSQQYLNIDVNSRLLTFNRPQLMDLYAEILQKLDTTLDSHVIVG